MILWLTLDDLGRKSVAGRLDPTSAAFVAAWHELHGHEAEGLLSALAADDLEGFRARLFAKADPNFNQKLRVARSGGDVLESAPGADAEEESLLAIAGGFRRTTVDGIDASGRRGHLHSRPNTHGPRVPRVGFRSLGHETRAARLKRELNGDWARFVNSPDWREGKLMGRTGMGLVTNGSFQEFRIECVAVTAICH
jgi:hypothetical protein